MISSASPSLKYSSSGIAAHVGEREHRDGGSLSGGADCRLLQCGSDLRHRLEPIARLLGEAAAHDALEGRGRLERRRPLVYDCGDGRKRRVAAKRPAAAQHLVEHRAEGEHVRPCVHCLPLGLLGRHVRHGAHDDAGLAQRHADRPIAGQQGRVHLRQAEVEQLCSALGHQDIGRLQIAMHDPLAMRRGQCLRDLHRQPHRIGDGHGPRQDLTLDVLHHQVIRPDVIELADVWMIECGDRTSFALESLGVLGLEALDGDDTIDSRVAGFPHFAHSARAQRSGQLVGAKSNPGSPPAHGSADSSGCSKSAGRAFVQLRD